MIPQHFSRLKMAYNLRFVLVMFGQTHKKTHTHLLLLAISLLFLIAYPWFMVDLISMKMIQQNVTKPDMMVFTDPEAPKRWKSMEKSSIFIYHYLSRIGFFYFFGGGCYTVTRSTMAGPIDPMANLHGLGRRFGRPSGESGPRPSRSPGCWRCAGRTASSLGTSSPEIHGFLTSFDQLGETSEPENPWLIWHIDHPNWMASPQTFPNQIQWNSTWGPFRWIGFLGKSWVCTCRFSPNQSCDCCLLWRIKVIHLQYRGTWCHQPHFQK